MWSNVSPSTRMPLTSPCTDTSTEPNGQVVPHGRDVAQELRCLAWYHDALGALELYKLHGLQGNGSGERRHDGMHEELRQGLRGCLVGRHSCKKSGRRVRILGYGEHGVSGVLSTNRCPLLNLLAQSTCQFE
jgi:hypothetical protein